MQLVTLKNRPVTERLVVCCRPELARKSLHDVGAYHRRKGAWNAGFHYVIIKGELKEGIAPELYADVVYKRYDTAIILIIPKAIVSKKDRELIDQVARKHNLKEIVFDNRVEE